MNQLPKRLTPLQTAIESIRSMYMENHLDGEYGRGLDNAYQKVITVLEELLPSEQKLLEETSDAGSNSKIYYVDYDIRDAPFVNSKDVAGHSKNNFLSQFKPE